MSEFTDQQLDAMEERCNEQSHRTDGHHLGPLTLVESFFLIDDAREAARLAGALRRYGRHTDDCASRSGVFYPDPCDCGFDAVLAGTAERQEPRPYTEEELRAIKLIYDPSNDGMTVAEMRQQLLAAEPPAKPEAPFPDAPWCPKCGKQFGDPSGCFAEWEPPAKPEEETT